MKRLYEVRKTYGDVYVTAFDDGLLVPWKPLPLGDYLKYEQNINRGLIPLVSLEDEIFCKCVLDSTLIRQKPFLKAGIISTVVLNIWEYSGPEGIEGFNRDLDTARLVLNADGSRAIHDLVQLVTMAFPYKPEEVYSMEYETFLLRVIQAEKKLLDLGLLKVPVEIQDVKAEQERHQKKMSQSATQQARPSVDAKKLWEEQEQKIKEPTAPISKGKWWKESPVLEATEKHNIDFAAIGHMDDMSGLDSHELAEPKEMREYLLKQKTEDGRTKLIEDAKWIYKDLIEKLNERHSK